MTLSQIKCFLVVAEEKSVTEAANRLFVTQPAVSHSIRMLRQELGCELFYRDGSRIELTAAGRKYAAFFSDFLSGLQKLSAEVSSEIALSEKRKANMSVGSGYFGLQCPQY